MQTHIEYWRFEVAARKGSAIWVTPEIPQNQHQKNHHQQVKRSIVLDSPPPENFEDQLATEKAINEHACREKSSLIQKQVTITNFI
jgi:hypothetical protein